MSFGQSGKTQVRSVLAMGREWTEVYGTFSPFKTEGRELLGYIHRAWRSGETFSIQHRFYELPTGLGTGSPVVNGAGQTGSTLSTRSWTGANPVLRIGDVFTVVGVPYLLECTDVATNLSAGVSTLTIAPPIITAPADGAAIGYIYPIMSARIIEKPVFPNVDSEGLLTGVVVTFKEAL
jgi:hypothetical protein